MASDSTLQPSRTRCQDNRTCWSIDFTGTKRMLPWRAAVAIASASARSFFVRLLLRYGLTNWAAMIRGSKPYARQRRA
jgi:hypothetical protein